MKILWKPVPGYEGLYEVSDQGQVRTFRRGANGRLLKPGRMPSGHLSVSLGKRNSQCVHRLVLIAFVGPALDKYECLHINGDPSDNRLQNLRWGTRSENIKDKTRHGLAKLKPDEIVAIKEALKNSYHGMQAALARKFNVAECTISDIKKGRTHV